MKMMILKMEMILILKELKQLLLIIFVLLLIYFIIFYQIHFKKMYLDIVNFFIKKDIYINYYFFRTKLLTLKNENDDIESIDNIIDINLMN